MIIDSARLLYKIFTKYLIKNYSNFNNFQYSTIFAAEYWKATQQIFTCSKPTPETLRKGVKYFQS